MLDVKTVQINVGWDSCGMIKAKYTLWFSSLCQKAVIGLIYS